MKTKLFSLLVIAFLSINAFSQKTSNAEALKTVKAFLSSLESDKLAKASFPYDNAERRNWFFTPVERKGLPLLEMSEIQKEKAIDLVKATVSKDAAQTSIAIMQMEIVLKQIEKLAPENMRRHPEKYYFSIFGTPSKNQLWGWRIEGHHISLNFSSESGKIVSGTPLFFGSNPAIVPVGYPNAGKQILKAEEVLGIEFLKSMTAAQKAKAIVSDKCPADILSYNSPHFAKFDSLKAGISYKEFSKDQQIQLLAIIGHYLKRYQLGFANEFMEKIEKAGLDNLTFTWMGAQEAKIGNGGHYYRIQNSVVFIEYDNQQNDANHIHTVIRDLTNDFGENMLGKHYKAEH